MLWSTSIAIASRVKAPPNVSARKRRSSNRAFEAMSIDHIALAADAAGCRRVPQPKSAGILSLQPTQRPGRESEGAAGPRDPEGLRALLSPYSLDRPGMLRTRHDGATAGHSVENLFGRTMIALVLREELKRERGVGACSRSRGCPCNCKRRARCTGFLPRKQPLGRSAWEGVHRATTREPGDLPASGRSCPGPGGGRGTVYSV